MKSQQLFEPPQAKILVETTGDPHPQVICVNIID